MAENVRLWQNRDFEVKIWAPPPQEPESNELQQVEKIHELTPYGLLLASFGECTGIETNFTWLNESK